MLATEDPDIKICKNCKKNEERFNTTNQLDKYHLSFLEQNKAIADEDTYIINAEGIGKKKIRLK